MRADKKRGRVWLTIGLDFEDKALIEKVARSKKVPPTVWGRMKLVEAARRCLRDQAEDAA